MSLPPSKKPYFRDRTLARFAAVQALFQIEQSGESASSVILEFIEHRLKAGEVSPSKANTTFFSKLVAGSWQLHESSDEMIKGALKAGWELGRIESVTRAILRAALFELRETKTPALVIIDEYLTIVRDFFDNTEVTFVNGVLNTLARKIRPSLEESPKTST